MQEAFQNIPPFTRLYGILCAIMALIVKLRIVNPIYLIYIPSAVFKNGEIWRILTAPFFIGDLDLNFLIRLITSFMFVYNLEINHFSKRISNLVFIFILNTTLVYIFSTILISFDAGNSIIFSLEYLYSKLFSHGIFRLFMIIPIPAAYLPFVNIALIAFQGHSIISSLIGILAGHITFYLLFILPIEMNRPFLKCPQFLVDWLDDNGFPNPEQANRQQNPMAGRGRRIGD